MSTQHDHDHDHEHDHDHDHEHDHDHDHEHEHEHDHEHGWRHRLGHLLQPHRHDSADKIDDAMAANRAGMRALWVSLAGLGGTAALQAVVVVLSGSVALLGDTLHNVGDALTVVPLGIAFTLGRRAANRRYTYGYGRAEDLAGVAIVLVIAASAALAGYEAIRRLAEPQQLTHLWTVALAGLIGFAGNEWVARYRITVGRRIGSAALVADGLHARADGFTSLAVLLGAGGAALGWERADPIVGLLITGGILLILRDAVTGVWRRLMDAVDPDVVETAERTVRGTPGVLDADQPRMRWIGHRLRAEVGIVVDHRISAVEAHAIAVATEHALLHAVPHLSAATVHADPNPVDGVDHHAVLAHHRSS